MFDDILQIYSLFEKHGAEAPWLETLRLSDLLTRGALRTLDFSILEEQGVRLSEIVERRKEGVPLERIVGKSAFMGLLFFCTPDVLSPRQETELLARTALSFIAESEADLTVVDVGTGCGNIAVSLAAHSDNTTILATDISPEAIEVARRNVALYNLERRIELFCGDLFSPLLGTGYQGEVDMVVCNPPYIPTSSLDKLPPEILDYEPTIALDAGPYGISFFRRLIADSLSILKPGGILVFEIGEGQHKLVTRLLERNQNYDTIAHHLDGDRTRVISAVKKPLERE
jgi:release factor glutamine methyltransferase